MSPPKPGLYRVWWNSGGSSLAAVGVTPDGGRWLAPVNWVAPTVTPDWSTILRMDPIGVGEPNGRPTDWVEHIRHARDLLSTVLDEPD